MVDHLTRILLDPMEGPVRAHGIGANGPPTPEDVRRLGASLSHRAERVAAMMEALARRGFHLRLERDRIVAESEEVGGREAKRYLNSLGFRDREFQVLLEYVRKWGVL